MKYIVLFCLFIFIFSINLNAAIQHLMDNAEPKSTKNCGTYVANALEAGGFVFTRQKLAYQYWSNEILTGIGYYEINKSSSYEKGDITVTENNEDHPEGHIAMWNGTNWISDFVQKSEYVYNSNQPPIHYYRYNNTNDDLESDLISDNYTDIITKITTDSNITDDKKIINPISSSTRRLNFKYFSILVLFLI